MKTYLWTMNEFILDNTDKQEKKKIFYHENTVRTWRWFDVERDLKPSRARFSQPPGSILM